MGLCSRKLLRSCLAAEREIRNESSFHWHNEGKDTPNRKNTSMGHLLKAIFSLLTLGDYFRCYILKSWLQRDQGLALWQLAWSETSTTLSSFKATLSTRTSLSYLQRRLLCRTAKGGWRAMAPVPALFRTASWKGTQCAAASREAGLCGVEDLSCLRSSSYCPDSPFLLAAGATARPALGGSVSGSPSLLHPFPLLSASSAAVV